MATMKRRLLFLAIGTAIVILPLAIVWVLAAFPQYVSGIHQRGVTRELGQWKTEYSAIATHHDALRTAGMLEYVEHYYVPGEGYRSTPAIEAALQRQRQDTMDAFVAALRAYTGADFGSDSAKWLEYLESVK
jgi:hypothetical protein